MVDLAGQAVAAILTRAPSAGGKSRLFAALGRPPDAALLAALLLDTFDEVARSGLTAVVCFTPESARDELRALMPEVILVPQSAGDLGSRMRGAFDDLLRAGARSVVLVGSDLPLLDADSVRSAAALLDESPRSVILGPTRDGGYYLVGATRTPVELLEDVEWGTPSVLEQTRRLANLHRIHLQQVSENTDVDTLADLRALIEAHPARAQRTRHWARRATAPSSNG